MPDLEQQVREALMDVADRCWFDSRTRPQSERVALFAAAVARALEATHDIQEHESIRERRRVKFLAKLKEAPDA